MILPPEAPGVIDDRPLPAPYNLGEWEDDGEGDVLIIMSGVYSIKKGDKVKTTFRGSASYFLRGYDSIFKFCEDHADARTLKTTVRKPYSAREARQRSNLDLINVFDDRTYSLSAMGDSNKRRWPGLIPSTFGDLTNEWFASTPHERLN